MEVHTQPRNDLINREREKDIMNHPLINTTIIISAMNIMAGKQRHGSDVDYRIISS